MFNEDADKGPLMRTAPFTERALVPGLFVLMATPPLARMRNWFTPVETKSVLVLMSDQTNVPELLATA